MEGIEQMATAHLTESAQQLQKQVSGSVIGPNDPDYDKMRPGWNLSIDQHPALILVAANTQDIVKGVNFARENGLGVGVRLTGHGTQHPADDSLLILTSKLSAVHIDPEARTAHVEAGAIWKQVLDAATPHGLAPLLGTSPHVGIVGYTLGGGIGWLGRRYGLAADSVRSIDIVTPDGELRHTSLTENSDLFWGLRGGGGNFGVVTALEFSLYPVKAVYGGSMTYPGELAGDALRFFRDWTSTAPDELTSSIAVLRMPSIPQIPEHLRGKVQVIIRAAFAGNANEGQALIQRWLDWHKPDSNTFNEMPFSEIATIQNDPVDPAPGAGSSEMFDELSDKAIDIIVRTMNDSASPIVFSELRHVGGAIKRVDADANAIGNRDANFYLVIGGPLFTREARAAIKPYIEQYKDALKPYLRGGVYLNFMGGFLATTETRTRTKDAYLPTSFEKLQALKAKYDPNNLFRFSYQIVPAKAGVA